MKKVISLRPGNEPPEPAESSQLMNKSDALNLFLSNIEENETLRPFLDDLIVAVNDCIVNACLNGETETSFVLTDFVASSDEATNKMLYKYIQTVLLINGFRIIVEYHNTTTDSIRMVMFIWWDHPQ